MGTTVARWPGPVLVAAIGLVALLALPLAGMRVGWNEIDATPSGSESNRGYAAADRHFPANQILPTAVVVTADHSLRNPAGLLALERVSRALMAIPGVRSVQSASRPAGRVPEAASSAAVVSSISAFSSISGRSDWRSEFVRPWPTISSPRATKACRSSGQ